MNTKHGLSKTRFHKIWEATKRRGTGRVKGYERRKICNKWLNFKSFKDDMYESYIKHVDEYGEMDTTIERKNNSKGYNKKNCTWATRKEQARNTKQFVGISELFEAIPINKSTIRSRYYRGWSLDKIKNTPVRYVKK